MFGRLNEKLCKTASQNDCGLYLFSFSFSAFSDHKLWTFCNLALFAAKKYLKTGNVRGEVAGICGAGKLNRITHEDNMGDLASVVQTGYTIRHHVKDLDKVNFPGTKTNTLVSLLQRFHFSAE